MKAKDYAKTFRDFTDTKIRWVCSNQTHWRAYFNVMEIGGYSTEPAKTWTGIYSWGMGNKFVPFPETEEQARLWIEQTFKRWVARAADLYLGMECHHDWQEEYYGTRCSRCYLFFAHGHAPWDVVGEGI